MQENKNLGETGFGCIHSSALPYKEQARMAEEQAGKMAQYIGDRIVAAYPIGYGAGKDFALFEQYLADAGVDVRRPLNRKYNMPRRCINQADDDFGIGRKSGYSHTDGEYRIILHNPKELVVPDARVALLFDDMNASGTSYGGGVAFMLFNQKVFNFDELWTCCVRDRMNLISWPVIETEPDKADYGKDWSRFFQERMPKTYEELAKEGLFSFLR